MRAAIFYLEGVRGDTRLIQTYSFSLPIVSNLSELGDLKPSLLFISVCVCVIDVSHHYTGFATD